MIRLLNYLNNPKRIVDVGANVGEFSTKLHSHFPDCKFQLVEANKNCEQYLKKLPFFYEIIALGKESGELDFYIETSNPIATGASLKKENTVFYEDGKYVTERVKIETLDSRNYFGSDTIDLLKLDVQGSELDILKGGEETLARTRYVLAEVSNIRYNKDAPLFNEVYNYMSINAFNVVDVVAFMNMETSIGPVVAQMDVLFQNVHIY